jgi:hypothetical protein
LKKIKNCEGPIKVAQCIKNKKIKNKNHEALGATSHWDVATTN